MHRENNYDYYRTKVPYPGREDYTTVYVTKRGNHVKTCSLTHWNALEDKPEGTVEKEFDKDAFNAAMKKYRLDQQRLNLCFKTALEREYGITPGKKADNLYDIAWSYGHSAGYSEVESHYDTLHVLILED